MSPKKDFSRREFLAVAGSCSLLALLGPQAFSINAPRSKNLDLFVGTYTTNTKSEGIYVCNFDLETGDLKLKQTVRDVVDPSFLTLSRNGKFLFAVSELVEYEGKPSGSVSSFAIDRKTGNLQFLNKQPTLGGAPCHLIITGDGKFALVANYVGGNVSVFPIDADGKLRPSNNMVQHTGSGPNKDRQLSPHAHSITLDNKERFAFAADLGIDRVMIYKFDDDNGKLVPNAAQPFFQTKPGAGPRHFAFHPKGDLAFVINELDSTITSLAYDPKAGSLREIQTASTLPPGFTGSNSCADVHVSPDGRFLYGSNRGGDSIAAFKIDQKTGKLTYLENTPTGGKRPRNFVIDPSGNFLLAANQDTGNIVVFRIDMASGKLTNTGKTIYIPSPVCLKFA